MAAARKTRARAKPRARELSHIDATGKPTMVDVTAKPTTARRATAECLVSFAPDAAEALRAADGRSRKGPVFDTAIIAGTQAVKRTHELIPFCHALPIEACRFEIAFVDATTVRIACEVATTARTGVEMEALTGASVAALTVYDMCKALGHGMVIGPLRLLEKRGGHSGTWRASR